MRELTRERDQLLAAVDILQETSSSLHLTEILQRIARRLGDLFGLDRCSIYLAGDATADPLLEPVWPREEARGARPPGPVRRCPT